MYYVYRGFIYLLHLFTNLTIVQHLICFFKNINCDHLPKLVYILNKTTCIH